jgi:hypothetical protein
MSTLVYVWLLNFYPDDLRREYGEEMVLVFADDLRSRGALRVWWNTLSELFRIALPHTLSLPAARVPLIGIAFAILSLSAEFVMTAVTHNTPRFTLAATLPSFAPVLLPCLVIWACRGRAVISLDIAGSETVSSK